MKLSRLVDAPVARDPEIAGLTADSRQVGAGFLFAALPGVNVDGTVYIPQAIEQGAVAILADQAAEIETPEHVAVLRDPEPRRALALIAARFSERQPENVVAVTGTNGKTSVAQFTAQLWRLDGKAAGSVGTVGVEADGYQRDLRHTTPDPVELHDVLAELAAHDVNHVAIEASSHGLAQNRLDGVRLAAAGFANISQDHLDYHADFEDYFLAKLRLFSHVLKAEGVAVINADGFGAGRVQDVCRLRGVRTLTVGAEGEALKLISRTPHEGGQHLVVEAEGERLEIDLPLIGDFQAANALLSAGLVSGAGAPLVETVSRLSGLKGVRGRLEYVGAGPEGGAVYVDYAHTPDAIETVLRAVRPHASSQVAVVFGAGGDRDQTKRPLMGEAAGKGAERVIVTDDNPRGENPDAIRSQVLAGCAEAQEIGDREAAIVAAVSQLQAGDVLVIAGKGHETGQIVGERTLPFDDAEVARRALRAIGGRAAEFVGAVGAEGGDGG